MLKAHNGVYVSDKIKEEDLLYFAKSVNPDGSPNVAKSFDQLMTESQGFLISVCEGKPIMPKPKYEGNNREKTIAHLEELNLENKTSATFQQYVAMSIMRLLSSQTPMDEIAWTCTSGSLLPEFSLVPFANWNYDQVGLRGYDGINFVSDGWRGRGGVLV